MVTPLDRYKGALLGLAAGDALGTTLEFKRRGTFHPVESMLGGGPFGLEPGQWTDDTSMALCLAESLIETRTFSARDQMERYVRWRREGYWSSTGVCFDIGNTTSRALSRFAQTGDPFAGPVEPDSAGNGSLMRLAPVPMRYARDVAAAVTYAGESSRTTHGAREAVDACRYYAALIVGALSGADKAELLSEAHSLPGVQLALRGLSPQVAAIAAGSFKRKSEADIQSSGYVLHTLEAALWAFHNSPTYAEGALLAVNLGHDADTTGAVYGQLAGAYYGVHAIPADWRHLTHRAHEIENIAAQLLVLANDASVSPTTDAPA